MRVGGSAMAGRSSVFVFALLVLCASHGHAERQEQRGEEEQEALFQDLEPQRPETVYESEGGTVEKFGRRFKALREAGFEASRLSVKSGGLTLPMYFNFDQIMVVTQGSGILGAITPDSSLLTQNAFKVNKGDAIVLPRGVTTWFFNSGRNDTQFIAIGHLESRGRAQGEQFRAFSLLGTRSRDEEQEQTEERGGKESSKPVIRGFSVEVLAHAWNIGRETVERLLQGQQEEGIILLSEEERRQMRELASAEAGPIAGASARLLYRLGDAYPELRVHRGGDFRELSSQKIPVLALVGLGGYYVKLEKGAMIAPNYFHNGHQVIYVTRGSGKLEIVRNNGERALEREIRSGELAVIPRSFPSVKLAGPSGFEYISVVNSHRPRISYLAGGNSVYKSIPVGVLSSGLKMSPDFVRKLQEQRREEAIIFPPKGSPREEEAEGSTQGERRREWI